MSYYQPPPSSGYPDHWGAASPEQALRAPARRASVTLLVMGICGLLFGACAAGASLFLQSEWGRQAMVGKPLPTVDGMTPEQMLQREVISGVVFAAVGFIAVVLGILVRKGRKGVVVTSIVFATVVGLDLLREILGSLLLIAGNPMAAVGIVFLLLPLILVGLALFWLAQAARNASSIAQQQNVLQSQVWQHQQQQATFGGYGYGAPVPDAVPQPPAGQTPVSPPQQLPGGNPNDEARDAARNSE